MGDAKPSVRTVRIDDKLCQLKVTTTGKNWSVFLDGRPYTSASSDHCPAVYVKAKCWQREERVPVIRLQRETPHGYSFGIRASGVFSKTKVLTLLSTGLGLVKLASVNREFAVSYVAARALTLGVSLDEFCLLRLLERLRRLRDRLDNPATDTYHDTRSACHRLLKLDPDATVEEWMVKEAYQKACELHVLQSLKKL